MAKEMEQDRFLITVNDSSVALDINCGTHQALENSLHVAETLCEYLMQADKTLGSLFVCTTLQILVHYMDREKELCAEILKMMQAEGIDKEIRRSIDADELPELRADGTVKEGEDE